MTVTTETGNSVRAPGAGYERLAATHYENFPVASWLLPRAARRHLRRIYAFARTADDLADEQRDAAALAAFRARFAQELAAPAPAAGTLLGDVVGSIRELRLEPALFFALLDAFALDLERARHDEASLLAYCRDSADPIGRLVLRVTGHRDPALDALSDRICTALQILNHLQDAGSDYRERARIYLPREDLVRFGVREADLAAATAGPPLRALVRHWTDRVAASFAAGHPLVGLVRGRLRAELRGILAGAAAVIRRIRAADHDVLGRPVRLQRGDRARILLQALFGRRMPAEFRPA
jgi:squalene synthase HpnC